jgi:hypothetical protein
VLEPLVKSSSLLSSESLSLCYPVSTFSTYLLFSPFSFLKLTHNRRLQLDKCPINHESQADLSTGRSGALFLVQKEAI